MLSPKTTAVLAASALALVGCSVDAHGTLTLPAPTFPGYGGGVAATIDVAVLPVPAGMTYSAGPDTNADAFDTAFKKTGQSLKAFILKNQDTSGSTAPSLSAECGFSDPNGTPQALPDKLQWGTSFIHPGPCEAWCDNEIVVPYTANCWTAFKDGSVPYAKAKCGGKKRLTFYWLAVHSPPWQVYSKCHYAVMCNGGVYSGENEDCRGGSLCSLLFDVVHSQLRPTQWRQQWRRFLWCDACGGPETCYHVSEANSDLYEASGDFCETICDLGEAGCHNEGAEQQVQAQTQDGGCVGGMNTVALALACIQ